MSRADASRFQNVFAMPGVDLAALLDQAAGRPRQPPEEVRTFRVRVDLHGASPPVWRRLDLAGDLRLLQVHEILRAAIGASHIDRHEFVLGPGRRGRWSVPVGLRDEAEVRLDQVLSRPGERLYYDLGRQWTHRIEVQRVGPRHDLEPRAACRAGARSWPRRATFDLERVDADVRGVVNGWGVDDGTG